jgi:hypothetical protein
MRRTKHTPSVAFVFVPSDDPRAAGALSIEAASDLAVRLVLENVPVDYVAG